MMDPYTGEILALAQIPSFDPARYADYFNDPNLQEHTRVKAVSDCYEPGIDLQSDHDCDLLKGERRTGTKRENLQFLLPMKKFRLQMDGFPAEARRLKMGGPITF